MFLRWTTTHSVKTIERFVMLRWVSEGQCRGQFNVYTQASFIQSCRWCPCNCHCLARYGAVGGQEPSLETHVHWSYTCVKLPMTARCHVKVHWCTDSVKFGPRRATKHEMLWRALCHKWALVWDSVQLKMSQTAYWLPPLPLSKSISECWRLHQVHVVRLSFDKHVARLLSAVNAFSDGSSSGGAADKWQRKDRRQNGSTR